MEPQVRSSWLEIGLAAIRRTWIMMPLGLEYLRTPVLGTESELR